MWQNWLYKELWSQEHWMWTNLVRVLWSFYHCGRMWGSFLSVGWCACLSVNWGLPQSIWIVELNTLYHKLSIVVHVEQSKFNIYISFITMNLVFLPERTIIMNCANIKVISWSHVTTIRRTVWVRKFLHCQEFVNMEGGNGQQSEINKTYKIQLGQVPSTLISTVLWKLSILTWSNSASSCKYTSLIQLLECDQFRIVGWSVRGDHPV